jgi:hypothetical protein
MEPIFVRFIGHSSPVALGNSLVGQVSDLKVAETGKGADIMGYTPTFRNLAVSMAAALALLAGACVSPAGPVEAVRFVSPDRAAELGRGPIRVIAGEGMDPSALEFRSYAAAVERELERIGYQVLPAGAGAARDVQTAMIRIERMVVAPGGPQRNPVSVGVGGGTGGFGSGLGVGIGLNLGGRPKERIATELFANIRSGDDVVLWEGRAMVEAKAGSPMAETQLNASKLSEGLFTDFPGESGATIKVP